MDISEISICKIGLATQDPSLDDYRQCGQAFFDAFSKIGFAYIRNHGIEPEVIESAFETSRAFFLQSFAEKILVSKTTGFEQGFVARGREVFDANQDYEKASDEIREAFDMTSLRDDGVYPEVAKFKESMTSLARATRNLAVRVLKALAFAVGQHQDFFVERHQHILEEGNTSQFRTLFYPPISEEDSKIQGAVRCGTHSDYGTLTFLFQDKVGGLEVQALDKSWIQATPIEGCILVNVGDLLERFTNGLFTATRHRVLMPEDGLARKIPRQSMAFFLDPDCKTQVEPLPGLNGEPRFEPVISEQYLLSRFQATFY